MRRLEEKNGDLVGLFKAYFIQKKWLDVTEK
jgi:hypothetical protein